MRSVKLYGIVCALSVSLLVSAGPVNAADMGTEVSYQGFLDDGGIPVNGQVDMKFTLYAFPTVGFPIGTPAIFDGQLGNGAPVNVTDGLLTVMPDLGANEFGAAALWLEIQVRNPHDPTDSAAYVTLDPRQPITAVPVALQTRGIFVEDPGGEVGIGTTNPNEALDVVGNVHASGTIASGASITIDGVNDEIRSNGNLELHVANGRVLRLEDNGAISGPNVIAGDSSNSVSGGVIEATISGGDQNTVTASQGTIGGGTSNTAGSSGTVGGGFNNEASDIYATVAGGVNNIASGLHSSVGGGSNNRATVQDTTIAGGRDNEASGANSVICGGADNVVLTQNASILGGALNVATGGVATIGGGGQNTASGTYGTVPGGSSNSAGGDYSFAAGRNAKVRNSLAAGDSNGDEGTFIWADSTNQNFTSSGPDQFLIRANGGVGIGTETPNGALHIRAVDPITMVNLENAGTGRVLINAVAGASDPRLILNHNRADGAIQFHIANSPKLSVAATGDVGIGTTTPSEALEVVGNLHASGTITSGSSITIDGDSGNERIVSTDAIEVHTSDGRGWRLEPAQDGTFIAPNIIGGSTLNTVGAGAVGATVAGGGQDDTIDVADEPNRVFDSWGTVSGGRDNVAGVDNGNPDTARFATVGGGLRNTASGTESTVAGGFLNVASGLISTVGGGFFNSAGGQYATVAGGHTCRANGDYSFAVGRRAKADNDGSFVFADSTNSDFISTAANQVRIRAGGGTQIYSNTAATVGVQLAAGGNSWSALSDRSLKENISAIDPVATLEKLAAVPVTEWNLMSQNPSIRHVGPMAQDFHAAFGLGESKRHISGSDADGIAFAAIQGLHEMILEKDCEIEGLLSKNAELEARLARIEGLLAAGEGGVR